MMPLEKPAAEIEIVPEIAVSPARESAPVSDAATEKAVEFVASPVEQDLPPQQEASPDLAPAVSVADAELLCLAKIVHHEAANQTEAVQLAVANVVLNRVASGRFAPTICGVALQPNQFFNVHAYRPYNDPRWATSQRIAREAVAGKGREHAPGALFFRTAGYQSAFFAKRPHIARLGGLDFHR